MEEVRRVVQGRVAMLAGHSGVGKSLVVNRLDPEAGQKVGDVSWKKERGSHTTSTARLLPFAGGYLLDTPGVRSFSPLLEQDIGPLDFYQEWRSLPSSCRFNDCRHEREPDCAVKEEMRKGRGSWLRYRNYCQMLWGER